MSIKFFETLESIITEKRRAVKTTGGTAKCPFCKTMCQVLGDGKIKKRCDHFHGTYIGDDGDGRMRFFKSADKEMPEDVLYEE